MSPTTAYNVQISAAETALKLARDARDIAAILAALSTMTRLLRQRYWAGKLAS
jgi:hypothetical protein